MNEQEFRAAVALGHEQYGVEFKGPGPRRDKPFIAEVIRAVLGMANRRDGGHVIIGVLTANGDLQPVGLDPDDVKSWNHDDFATDLANYANPSVTFDRLIVEADGRRFIVLRVHEFDDVPILCKKEFSKYRGGKAPEIILRQGACYVRSRAKPGTSDIPSQDEMRELLDLAAEKKARKLIATIQRLGLSGSAAEATPTAAQLFADQLGDFR